jgi:hypothetical protein
MNDDRLRVSFLVPDSAHHKQIVPEHGTTMDRNFDVHMAATANGDFTCQKCHTTQLHKIAGRGSDLRQADLDVKMSCSTTSCHSTKAASNDHSTTGVNKHVVRVACQACHIPKSAKSASDTAATEATETNRDWSVSEWSTANNRWEPTPTLANDIKSQYKFWNGTSSRLQPKRPRCHRSGNGQVPDLQTVRRHKWSGEQALSV